MTAGCVQMEGIADCDDEFADLFLEADGDTAGIPHEHVYAALRRITMNPSLGAVPVLCGAAYKNKGVQPLMDAVVKYLPSPTDVAPVEATLTKSETGETVLRKPSVNEPLCALAFKVRSCAMVVRGVSSTHTSLRRCKTRRSPDRWCSCVCTLASCSRACSC